MLYVGGAVGMYGASRVSWPFQGLCSAKAVTSTVRGPTCIMFGPCLLVHFCQCTHFLLSATSACCMFYFLCECIFKKWQYCRIPAMLTDRHLGTMFCANPIPTFQHTTNLIDAMRHSVCAQAYA